MTSGRQRQLNIVYFIDASRTRSLRIPMGRLKLILAGCGLVVLWALFSIALVIQGAMRRDAMGDSMKTLLSALFEYQTRYENVFEMAYPDKPATVVASSIENPSDDIALPPTDAAAVSLESTPAAPPVENDSVDVPATDVPSAQKLVVSGGSAAFGLKVERLAAGGEGSRFSLTVDLRNKNNPAKAEGSIYIAVQVQYADGKTVWVGWPSSVQIKGDGIAAAPDKATPYSIKNFKSQEVDIEIPGRTSGKVGEVRVVLRGKDGKESSYSSQVGRAFQAAK